MSLESVAKAIGVVDGIACVNISEFMVIASRIQRSDDNYLYERIQLHDFFNTPSDIVDHRPIALYVGLNLSERLRRGFVVIDSESERYEVGTFYNLGLTLDYVGRVGFFGPQPAKPACSLFSQIYFFIVATLFTQHS